MQPLRRFITAPVADCGGKLTMPMNLTHAGVVAYRDTSETPEFLVVSASNRRQERVFPKGHIESGETPEATARRELKEEAGLIAEIVNVIGEVEFQAPTGRSNVRYFLARVVGSCEEQEKRDKEWLSYKKARMALTFEDARKVLDLAVSMIGL